MKCSLTISRSALLFFVGFLALLPARAGCVSDCRDEYESAIESCKTTYDDPDESDDLEQCLNNARDEYQDCAGECRS